jgi:hypothetical protein
MSKQCKDLTIEQCHKFPLYCILYDRGTKCRKKTGKPDIPQAEYDAVFAEEPVTKASVKLSARAPIGNFSRVKDVSEAVAKAVAQAEAPRNNSRLPTNVNVNNIKLIEFINSDGFRDTFGVFIRGLGERETVKAIELYQLLKSSNFQNLLRSLKIETKFVEEIQDMIPDIAIGDNILIVANKIVDMVKLLINVSDTDYIYKSSSNVQTTEDVADVGIRDFTSIARNFYEFKYFKKSSASTSLIFSAKLRPLGIANQIKRQSSLVENTYYFKVFPIGEEDSVEYDTSGLQTELKMYNELFKLVKYNITPNILCRIATSDNIIGLEHFIKSSGVISGKFREDFEKYTLMPVNRDLGIDTKLYWSQTNMIITHPGGQALEEVLHILTNEQLRQVMFQLLYNLYVFDKLGVSHGDLHIGNIFIIAKSAPVELNYIIEGTRYKIVTDRLVKIYDFDQSMIEMSTTIQINKYQTAIIEQIDNPIREPDAYFAMNFAQTSFYNKNLDLLIAITHEAAGLIKHAENKDTLTIMGRKNPEFDDFIRSIIPGFDNTTPISRETIKQTYEGLLKLPINRNLLEEANNQFGLNSSKPYKFTNYKIAANIANSTWFQYYQTIRSDYGRIKKSTRAVQNNSLWIPPNVVLNKIDMIRMSYFDSFRRDQSPIDITRNNVYTIDGKILAQKQKN